ncbi:DNA ligase [Paenibacillaceae bacterium]|nr:DNA ligase [Paenibacillaceae bacterium]
MLLTYADNNLVRDTPNTLTELKLDGIRLIVSKTDKVRLYTRHNNNVTSKFPELLDTPIDEGTILDGELIVTDENGHPDFEAVMSRFQSKKSKVSVVFCAFDILRYRGIDVTSLSLLERKKLLSEAFEETSHYKLIQPVNGSATAYFEVVKRFGLEGIVIKDLFSSYIPDTRRKSWRKVINWIYADVTISGLRKKKFGWLTSTTNPDGLFTPSGIVEFGVSPEQKRAFKLFSKQLICKEDNNFIYLEPKIKIKVKTRNWTKNNMLRSPVFVEFTL